MSNMKRYIGAYSYTGKYKELKDGSISMEVSEFTYGGRYYHPKAPIKFKITHEPEEGGWLWVEDKTIAVGIGGVGLQEALGNAFMMAADQYEDLVPIPDEKARNVREVRDKLRTWQVYDIDSKAQ